LIAAGENYLLEALPHEQFHFAKHRGLELRIKQKLEQSKTLNAKAQN